MSSNQFCYEDDISDEQDLTFKALKTKLEDKHILLNSKTMNTLGLKTKTGEYTNLAYLLSDQSEIVVKVAEYDSKLNFKIKKSFNGPLFKVLENVVEQTDRLNDLQVVINESSFKRIETISYPDDSLRDMVINAICNANYYIHSNIKVEFFQDKVKITVPGGLLESSIEEIMNGIQTYRNPKLVHIFEKLGIIDNIGTVISNTLKAYKDYEIKPEFNDTGNFFIVTLPNRNWSNNDPIKSKTA